MSDDDRFTTWIVFAFILITLCSFVLGWVIAHSVVAKECERLNSFYAGTVVYECKVRGLK